MTALRLDLEWRTTLLTALLLPTLVALGFWQLERAGEKAAIAAANAAREGAPPADLALITDLGEDEAAFRRVRLRGHFLADAVILLDNQVRGGRYGHDVLGVFVDDASAQAVLLNRGWVPGDPARRSLPDVEVPAGNLELVASVYVPPGEPWVLAEETFADLAWPLLVQQANGATLREALTAVLGEPLFPHELRLLPGQPHGFRRDWAIVNVAPEKHRGYAVQWFTMAAALLLFFILRSSNLYSVLRGNRRAAHDSEEH